MANLPEFERKVGITPQATPTGMQGALSNIGQSSKVLEQFGDTVAQNSANELARIDAINSYRNGQRQELLPPISQTDASYVKAYSEEESHNLTMNGSKYLNESLITALKNPTPGALKAYEKNANSTLSQLLEQSSEMNRGSIRTSLENSYVNNYLRLEQAVEAQNEKVLDSNDMSYVNQGLIDIQNFNLNSNSNAAAQKKEDLLKFIDNRGASGRWLPEKVRQAKDLIDKTTESSFYQNEWRNAYNKKQGEAYIAGLAEKPPQGMTPVRHQEIMASTMQYAHNYEAAFKAQQNISYAEAQLAIAQGGINFDNIDSISDNLSPLQIANLKLSLQKQLNKSLKSQALMHNIDSESNDIYAMNKYSPKQIDSWWDEKLNIDTQATGQKPGFERQALIATTMQAPIPKLNKDLSAALRNGSTEDAIAAARAYRFLSANHAIAVKDLDKDSEAILEGFDVLARNTSVPPEESLKIARDNVLNATPEERAGRLENFKDWQQQQDLNTYGKQIEFLADNISGAQTSKWFGLSSRGDTTKVPASLPLIWKKLAVQFAPLNKDPESASKMALREIEKTFQVSGINGESEIMPIAPESVLPSVGNYIPNDRVRALKQIVEGNKQLKAQGGQVFNDLEWPDAPDTSNLFGAQLVEGNPKIKIDGTEREVFVQSDYTTQVGAGGVPSWAFMYKDDIGMLVPLWDANNRLGARWYPEETYAQVDDYVKATNAATEKMYLDRAYAVKEYQTNLVEAYKQQSNFGLID